jgi:hypothetical protein
VGESSDGPIGFILLPPLARGGRYHNSIPYTHSSTSTVPEIFQLTPWAGGCGRRHRFVRLVRRPAGPRRARDQRRAEPNLRHRVDHHGRTSGTAAFHQSDCLVSGSVLHRRFRAAAEWALARACRNHRVLPCCGKAVKRTGV